MLLVRSLTSLSGMLATRTNTATHDPAPSLGSHYRSLVTTTSRSASAPRNGTHARLNPWLLPVADETSSQRTDFATQCRDAPSPRFLQEQQTRLMPPQRRTPPGQKPGYPPGPAPTAPLMAMVSMPLWLDDTRSSGTNALVNVSRSGVEYGGSEYPLAH
ncbi:MAG: hypothetical protein QOF66_1367 [Mycobacterium sp.]|nr:hypothetical protein [Mycobacterium sp.]